MSDDNVLIELSLPERVILLEALGHEVMRLDSLITTYQGGTHVARLDAMRGNVTRLRRKIREGS